MEVPGKVVLITGGKRMGAVIATTLAAAGADVSVVYNRSRPEADETVAAVRGPTKPASASSTGTSARAGPSHAAASHDGPGRASPSSMVTGSTDSRTPLVRSRIRRI